MNIIYYNIISNISWGLGIGDWGLGIAQSPIPNPPYYTYYNIFILIHVNKLFIMI